jgi:hypothetical protein
MRAIIYGNGPSLLTAPLKEAGVERFGVNRSYEVAYAENWVTADARALHARLSWKNNILHGDKASHLHLQPHTFRGSFIPNERTTIAEPVTIWAAKYTPSTSGAFAMHVAASLGFEKIYLVGFDGVRRRFYEKEANANISAVSYHKAALKQIWEWPKIDWRIWRDGWMEAEDILRQESK